MSTANIDSADLKAIAVGGLVREDVMNKIWDISKIPLPFTDMCGTTSSKQAYKEWTTDELAAPKADNAVVDGADAGAAGPTTGARVGNHHQISDKVVKVSYRADASDTIGRSKELAYQMMRKQQELRRDVEAICLLNQASIADDGDTQPGLVGGLPTWLSSNVVNKASNGFQTDTYTDVGTLTAADLVLTETMIRDVVEDIYNDGGNPTKLMAIPAACRKISEYLFTSSARVATLMSDQGKSSEKATALGSVNVFVTDFGTLTLVPNRLQLSYEASFATPSLTASMSDVFILDPEYVSQSFLKGYRTDTLAKTGLAENRQMSVDYTLVVNNEKAHGVIGGVDATADMTE